MPVGGSASSVQRMHIKLPYRRIGLSAERSQLPKAKNVIWVTMASERAST